MAQMEDERYELGNEGVCVCVLCDGLWGEAPSR